MLRSLSLYSHRQVTLDVMHWRELHFRHMADPITGAHTLCPDTALP